VNRDSPGFLWKLREMGP